MRNTLLCITIGALLAISGCNTQENTVPKTDIQKQEATETETVDQTTIANPWRNITAEEASVYYDNMFMAPEGATNVQWSVLDADTDSNALVQLTFDLDTGSGSMPFTARAKQVQDPDEDISGLYYDWDSTFEDNITYGEAQELYTTCYRAITDNETVDLCTWHTTNNNMTFSLSTHASDLDGFDITAIVLQMLTGSNEVMEGSAPDNGILTTDISDCNTFTQIVDKLQDGQGYANVTVDGIDVLLVSSGTFANEENFYAAIDAECFCYNEEGLPAFMGTVTSGGTAYPLAIADGNILSGSNHGIVKSSVLDSKIVPFVESWVEYDEDGNATYHYVSNEDTSDLTQEQLASLCDALLEEYMSAEVIEFTTVVK